MSSLSGNAGQLYSNPLAWPSQNDLWSEMGPYGFNTSSGPGLARRDSRQIGESLPTYLNWYQLKQIRDRCRQLGDANEFAIAGVESFHRHVTGTGFEYVMMAKKAGTVSESVLSELQEVIDLWHELNDIPSMEDECLTRWHEEGEWFIREFPGPDGICQLRFVEPELIRPPADSTDSPQDTFGIRCHPEDIHEVIGYWCVERPWIKTTPDLIPASEILHSKINVKGNTKRGKPTLYPIESNLRAAEDLLASMISLGKLRAKIGMIRRVKDSPPDAVEELERTASDGEVQDNFSGRSQSVNRFAFGTILTTTDNVEHEFPALNAGASDLVEILKANLRAIAARFGISEIMLTADPSGANYASSLTAESPSTKTFEKFQKKLAGFFGRNRTRGNRSLAWRQLVHAANCGLIDPDLLQLVQIDVKCPKVTARNKGEEATTHATYLDKGILSKASVRADLGKDSKTEQEQIDREALEESRKQQQQQPPAAVGVSPALEKQPPPGDPNDQKAPATQGPAIPPLPRPGES